MSTQTETAALMDSVYRHQRHIYDVSRKYYLLGRDELINRLEPGPKGTVLELGCGTGRNMIAAAKRYPDAVFHGIDISQEMLETAERNILKAGLAGRIRLAQGDAAYFDAERLFGRQAYDRVFFSYSLSMIPPWKQALAAGLAATADKGRLSFVDFGQQDRLPPAFKKLLFRWLAAFHVSPRSGIEESCLKVAGDLGGELSLENLYRGYAILGEIRKTSHTGQSPATK